MLFRRFIGFEGLDHVAGGMELVIGELVGELLDVAEVIESHQADRLVLPRHRNFIDFARACPEKLV